MEITLNIDGKDKTFVQNTVNIKTMRMALRWNERTLEQQQALIEMSEDIDAIEDWDEFKEKFDHGDSLFDGWKDIEWLVDLIVSFFNGQFTHDEFLTGAYFKNIGEFYEIGHEMFATIYMQKEQTEDEVKKKAPVKSRNKIS